MSIYGARVFGVYGYGAAAFIAAEGRRFVKEGVGTNRRVARKGGRTNTLAIYFRGKTGL